MPSKRIGLYPVALHLALATACVLVVLLARENRRLEKALVVSRAAAGGIKVGDPLPEVAVTELDGSATALRFDDASRDTVVLVFTTTCSACEQNLGRWLDLHEQLGERYRFVAIGVDEPQATRAWSEEHGLPFRVVVPVDRRYFPESFGLTGVPQTIVVGADGRVKDVQLGVLPERWYPDRVG